jgi:hypothetical protein
MNEVAEVKAAPAGKEELTVQVIYNGLDRPVDFRHGERVKALLDRAIEVFSPISQPHLLSLWTEAGVELKDSDIVDQAGVRPGDRLLLRPGAVKGG